MNHGKKYFIFYIGTCYSIVSCSPLILIGAHFSSLAINQLDDLSLFKNMMKKRPCSEITAFKNSDPGRTATLCRIVICTSANTTWRTAGTVWSVQNLCQLSLHGTNITLIQNSKMQPASSFTFSPVQLYYTCN